MAFYDHFVNSDNQKKRNYTYSHIGKAKAKYYEEKEYSNESYYGYIWRIERDYLNILSREFKKNKANSRKIKYLDFACGTGRIISFMENRVDNSTGIDVSKEMLKIAKRKVRKSKLYKKNIIKEELSDKFDLITAFRFFLNAEPKLRDDALVQLKKIMEKDSMLVFNIHGNKYSFRFLTCLIFRIFKNKKLNQMSYYDIRMMLKKHNLKILEYSGIGLLPKQLYRIKLISKFLYKLDRLFYKTGLLKFFSHNLIFIVIKND